MVDQSRTEKGEKKERERGTYDGVTEREVKAEEGGAGVVGGERRRKW
jgi:hypothetical protein